jgi:hypothetical protein
VNYRLLLLIGILSSCNREKEQVIDSAVSTILEKQLYVVHSLSMEGEVINTSSNIFVIRGTADTVWIFGTGYGDGDINCNGCNDYTYYRGEKFHTAHNALYDAQQVDSIIVHVFGNNRDSTVLQFIAPHFHADHLNAEFISAMHVTLQYPFPNQPNIRVHVNDSAGAICNLPCCGTEPCPDKDNQFYAAPYQPAWSEKQLAQFAMIGATTDACNDLVYHFSSPSGNWEVRKGMARADEGHTDGTVNLHNTQLKLRLAGTVNKPQCTLPEDWKTLFVHGNTRL